MGTPFTGVIFATPTFQRMPALEFTMSMVGTDQLLGAHGIGRGHLYVGGDPYISKARNKLASLFLDKHPEASDFFFLDDDIGWQPEAVLKFISLPHDVVAGVYPKKKDSTEFPCELLAENGKLIEKDGLYKATLVPTGFLRIKRHVLQKLADDSGIYGDPEPDGSMTSCYNIFTEGFIADAPGERHGKWWGEDYFFSARWRGMGGEIWVDPSIDFTHRGQKVWGANFNASVQAFIETQKTLEKAKDAQPS